MQITLHELALAMCIINHVQVEILLSKKIGGLRQSSCGYHFW